MKQLYLFTFGGWSFQMNRQPHGYDARRVTSIIQYVLNHPDTECTILLCRVGEKGFRNNQPLQGSVKYQVHKKLNMKKANGKEFLYPEFVELSTPKYSIKEEAAALALYLTSCEIKECRIMFPLRYAYAVWSYLDKTFPDTTFYYVLPSWIPAMPAWVAKYIGRLRQRKNQPLLLQNN